MSENNQIARPYATAAFEFAEANGALDAWGRALEVLSLAVQDEQMVRLLLNPEADQAALNSMLVDICADGDAHIQNFILLLAKNNRQLVAPDIFALFNSLKTAHEQRLDADVYSAFELNTAQLDKLQSALAKKYERKINLNSHLNSALIGGVVVRIGDQVIDNSILGKIKRLKAHLNLKDTICQ